MDVFERARGFIYRNARPLDFARWQYHFENGSADAVARALRAYQNADGGFAHALEADAWNINSSPIQTWAATEILREINFKGAGVCDIIKSALNYLDLSAHADADGWMNVIKSNNDYPHAPWWRANGGEASNPNPTAALAGFIMRFADKQNALYAKAARMAQNAARKYLDGALINDMHETSCYLRMLEDCERAGEGARVYAPELRARLRAQIAACVTADKANWDTGYACKPSQFQISAESDCDAETLELARAECDHILNTQQPDGAWRVFWQWRDYPGEWAISENWWKAHIIIQNLRHLRGFGRLQTI